MCLLLGSAQRASNNNQVALGFIFVSNVSLTFAFAVVVREILSSQQTPTRWPTKESTMVQFEQYKSISSSA